VRKTKEKNVITYMIPSSGWGFQKILNVPLISKHTMKAFRVKSSYEKTDSISFEFIFLSKCKKVSIDYDPARLLAYIYFHFPEGNSFTLCKNMNSLEYELFKFRYHKFIQSDELFCNLSDFSKLS